MKWLAMLPMLAYVLLILWVFITIAYIIVKLMDHSKKRTISRLELEQLQKIELKKRIELLDIELKTKKKE